MKQRFFALFLSLLLLISAFPVVNAVQFSDIQNHWAKEYIEKTASLGLFAGTTETTFSPEASMSRGMFVTVLGRLQGVDKAYWSGSEMPKIFDDVSDEMYYAPYVRWAVCNGVASGTSGTTFSPEAPVTREQIAKLVAFYIREMGHGVKPVIGSQIPNAFADKNQIASWAADSVELLRLLGIMNGITDADGKVNFLPQKTLTRAECATIFCRLNDSLILSATEKPQPTELSLNVTSMDLMQSDTYQLVASVNQPLIWRSNNELVVTVDEKGLVSCRSEGTAIVTAYAPNGLYASCIFTCRAKYTNANMTRSEKCQFLFGEVVDDPRLYYSYIDENGKRVYDYERAALDMTEVTVQVWDIGKDGNKYTKKISFKVHKSIAPTVVKIFEEIYNGEEKFPIHYYGGFSHGGHSEHTIGTAIDLNYKENYYCDPDGNPIVGDYWKPGEDPYSIPLDGEVVKIFEKYGFKQGVGWSSGYRDYMHFSFFGN